MIVMTTQTILHRCDYCEKNIIEQVITTDHIKNTTHKEPPHWSMTYGWTETSRYVFCPACSAQHSQTHLTRIARRKVEERRTARQENP